MRISSLHNKRIANRCFLVICVVYALSLLFGSLFSSYSIRATLLLMTILGEIIAIGLPSLIFMKRQGGLRAFGFKPLSLKIYVISFFLGLALAYTMSGVSVFLSAFWDSIGLKMIDTSKVFDLGGGPFDFLILFICVAVVPAIIEESLFRGAMFFSYLPWGRGRALFHTAMLFALLHINPQVLPVYFVIGLILAIVTLKSGSILPAIIMHFANNLLPVMVTGLMQEGQMDEIASSGMDAALETGLVWVSAVFAIALGAVVFWLLYRGFSRAVVQRQITENLILGQPVKSNDDIGEEGIKEEQKKTAKSTGKVALVCSYCILAVMNIAAVILLLFNPVGV